MKIPSILFISALSMAGIAARCQDGEVITKITFSSLTRGYQNEVFFTGDSLIAMENNRGEEKLQKRKLQPFEWQNLLNTTAGLKLDDIPDLPSPTSKRAFDGAYHSTITIHTTSGNSYTHSFDDRNPHASLMELMEAIIQTAGIKGTR